MFVRPPPLFCLRGESFLTHNHHGARRPELYNHTRLITARPVRGRTRCVMRVLTAMVTLQACAAHFVHVQIGPVNRVTVGLRAPCPLLAAPPKVLPASNPTTTRRMQAASSTVKAAVQQQVIPLLDISCALLSYACFPRIASLIMPWLGLPKKGVGMPTTDVWGAFCPVVGILFATLMSVTVDKLYARQEALRRILVEEAELLSHLTTLLYQADAADVAAATREANERAVASYRQIAIDAEEAATGEAAMDEAGTLESRPPHAATSAVASFKPSSRLERQAAASHTTAASSAASSDPSSQVGPKRSRPKANPPKAKGRASDDAVSFSVDPLASYRCIARHLHTLSHLVWGRGSLNAPVSTSLHTRSRAYAAELDAVATADPLAELMALHPLLAMQPLERQGAGTAWAAANDEARTVISKLMHARGQRLAIVESRPPLVQWLVLTFTASSLVLGFTIVALTTRPPTSLTSRLLFTSLTTALLAVLQLLVDLAEPFDGGSYTLAVKNVAGAILAPTRRRLVAALTWPRDAPSASTNMPRSTKLRTAKPAVA